MQCIIILFILFKFQKHIFLIVYNVRWVHAWTGQSGWPFSSEVSGLGFYLLRGYNVLLLAIITTSMYKLWLHLYIFLFLKSKVWFQTILLCIIFLLSKSQIHKLRTRLASPIAQSKNEPTFSLELLNRERKQFWFLRYVF